MTITTGTDGVMDADAARRLTERIRVTATNARDALAKLQELVHAAQEGHAHTALGYRSWPEYLADVLGEEPLRLPRDERREVVEWLSGEGMSTRAIAPIVGVDNKTVWNDQRAGVELSTPEPAPSAPTPDQLSTITGRDGKTYPAPEEPNVNEPPKIKRKRTPYPTAVARAARDVEAALDRLYSVIDDKRLDDYRDAVTTTVARTRNATTTIYEAIDALTKGETK